MPKKIPPAKHVQTLVPYKSTEAWRMMLRKEMFRFTHHREIAKLDYNESPFPISSKVIRVVKKDLMRHPLHWYPDPDYLELKTALAQHHGRKLTLHNFVVTNGSAEALNVVVKTYCNARDEVLIISPTYDYVRYAAELVNAKPVKFFLDTKFKFNFTAFKKKVTKRTKVVYLVNPNNPTGTSYSLPLLKEIAAYLQRKGVILIIDEAYMEFTRMKTAIPLIHTFTNVVVTRTFSKAYGLANFRVGYLMSHAQNIVNMEKTCSEFPINTLSENAAIAALRDEKHLASVVKKIHQNKELLVKGLRKKGFKVFDTPANFILVKVDDVDAVIDLLAGHNVVARPKKHLPPLEKFVRFTIGRRKDIKKILSLM